MEQVRWSKYIVSLIYVVLGAIIIAQPTIIGKSFCIILAVTLAIIGGASIASYILTKVEHRVAEGNNGLAYGIILIVLAVFSFTGRQIDSSFIAALLTIVGYSINDTIVIFDRIRENLKLHFRRGGDVNHLVNTSVFQTLTRSLYTVFTVMFTTFALYFFGGETTKDFAFALLVGFGSGCYSSIFIASPLWVVLRKMGDKKKAVASAAVAK